MRLDSCRQCIRRRIQCDAGVPHCMKCLRKGISCSGVGKQYRFISHDVANTKVEQSRETPIDDGEFCLAAEDRSGVTANEYSMLDDGLEDVATIVDHSVSITPNSTGIPRFHFPPRTNCVVGIAGRVDAPVPHLQSLNSLETIDSRTRMLFGHFSCSIAPAMVVIDDKCNGYRNILLPLAIQDPMVQQAISAVAALHLAKQQHNLLHVGENARSAIIKRLRHHALSGNCERIFTISTWAVVILLLVAETVTGDRDFVQLFAMLKRFLEQADDLIRLCPETGSFLLQQSQMFNLFTPPFLDADHGSTALQGQLDMYFDFLSYPTLNTTTSSVTLLLLRQAIHLTRDLYISETQNMLCPASRSAIVEDIHQLLIPLNEQTPGMHAFVWCYFIAGASSVSAEHRQFFLQRLKLVYNKTGMRNILITMDTLQQLVWQLPEGQNWTHSPFVLKRVLIM